MAKIIDMPKELLGWLSNAKGRAEFIIACVIDIRGFSAFSRQHESPDTAMYIKRFYSRVLEKYFPNANFAKPTGDGLLLTFQYEEETLNDVAKSVLEPSLRLLTDFSTICDGDPMVNFSTPTALGIGIARGPACCLYSGSRIIDYSGHLLNLASRLMDLARPSGIIIDGSFKLEVIPQEFRDYFEPSNVFFRSIAEENSHSIFYLKESVLLPKECFAPITLEKWSTEIIRLQVSELKHVPGRFRIKLPARVKDIETTRASYMFPHKKLVGKENVIQINDLQYLEDGNQPFVSFPLDQMRQRLKRERIAQNTQVRIEVYYLSQ